jgi:hypothetical protein
MEFALVGVEHPPMSSRRPRIVPARTPTTPSLRRASKVSVTRVPSGAGSSDHVWASSWSRIRLPHAAVTDGDGLRQALAAVAEGRRPPKSQSTRKLAPMLASLGYVDPVIRSAGPQASRDLLRAAPPMLLTARLTRLFAPSPVTAAATRLSHPPARPVWPRPSCCPG